MQHNSDKVYYIYCMELIIANVIIIMGQRENNIIIYYICPIIFDTFMLRNIYAKGKKLLWDRGGIKIYCSIMCSRFIA